MPQAYNTEGLEIVGTIPDADQIPARHAMRGHTVRGVRRLLIEAATARAAANIEGTALPAPDYAPWSVEDLDLEQPWIQQIKCTLVPVTLEIYADRLSPVLERVRTKEHEQIWKIACKSAKALRVEWFRDNKKRFKSLPPDMKATQQHLRCNIRPEQQLVLLGYRNGLPPLAFCKVVHPQTHDRMDAFEFRRLLNDDEAAEEAGFDADEWHIAAPHTASNAGQRANDGLNAALERATEKQAEAIAMALEKVMKNAGS